MLQAHVEGATREIDWEIGATRGDEEQAGEVGTAFALRSSTEGDTLVLYPARSAAAQVYELAEKHANAIPEVVYLDLMRVAKEMHEWRLEMRWNPNADGRGDEAGGEGQEGVVAEERLDFEEVARPCP